MKQIVGSVHGPWHATGIRSPISVLGPRGQYQQIVGALPQGQGGGRRAIDDQYGTYTPICHYECTWPPHGELHCNEICWDPPHNRT
jgi:hypothetical protein